MSKNRKTTTALERANGENARLRTVLGDTQRALREQRADHRDAIDTLVWALGEARHVATLERMRADEAETKGRRALDLSTFAQYDDAANESLERAGIAPKFRDIVLRELKGHVLTLDDDQAPTDPKKAKRFFEAFAKRFLQKNPELARRAPKAKKRAAKCTAA